MGISIAIANVRISPDDICMIASLRWNFKQPVSHIFILSSLDDGVTPNSHLNNNLRRGMRHNKAINKVIFIETRLPPYHYIQSAFHRKSERQILLGATTVIQIQIKPQPRPQPFFLVPFAKYLGN